jgi:uroporphyrinogen-III synthase
VIVWVTRPQSSGCLLRHTLHGLGATVVEVPLLSVQPLSPAPPLPAGVLQQTADWLLFTSQQAVLSWVAHPHAKAGLGPHTKIAVVGLKTAQTLQASAGLSPHLVSPVANATHLWTALVPHLTLASVVLWPCGHLAATQWLNNPHRPAVALVVPWVLYHTLAVSSLSDTLQATLRANPPAVVCFTSTSAVQAFASLGLQSFCQPKTQLTALGQPTATAIGTLLGLSAQQPPHATLVFIKIYWLVKALLGRSFFLLLWFDNIFSRTGRLGYASWENRIDLLCNRLFQCTYLLYFF